ncbi:hypothetical protein MRB53_039410 [Persea americana]|nr:hypothetical protein MRB53_039410 [Persea americana]
MAAACALVGKLADVRKVAHATHITPAKASPKVELAEPYSDDIVDDSDYDNILDLPEDSSTSAGEAPAPSVGGMDKFTQLKGIAAPMEIANIDTDAIIPKQFLKTIKRSGLGGALFHAWRYDAATGKENPDFILNKEPYRNSKILVVTGPNFGCGSSREHAPWALLDFGIRAVIAPSYADIFFNNTFKNGMLPLVLPNGPELSRIAELARAGEELEIDLPAQEVKSASGEVLGRFEVEEFRKHCLVNGLDDIGLTMQMDKDIARFEARRTRDTPWLDGSGYLKLREAGTGGRQRSRLCLCPSRIVARRRPSRWSGRKSHGLEISGHHGYEPGRTSPRALLFAFIMTTSLSHTESWSLLGLSAACVAILAQTLRGDGAPLVASIALSGLAFAMTYALIRWLGDAFMKRGFKGVDMSKAKKVEM